MLGLEECYRCKRYARGEWSADGAWRTRCKREGEGKTWEREGEGCESEHHRLDCRRSECGRATLQHRDERAFREVALLRAQNSSSLVEKLVLLRSKRTPGLARALSLHTLSRSLDFVSGHPRGGDDRWTDVGARVGCGGTRDARTHAAKHMVCVTNSLPRHYFTVPNVITDIRTREHSRLALRVHATRVGLGTASLSLSPTRC